MRRVLRGNRGAALVEFAIVSVLLIMLVFGIIEFALLMKDYLTVNQAAREGARVASLGYQTTVIRDHVVSAAPTLTLSSESVVLKTGLANTDSSGWADLGDDAGYNDADHGSMILVEVPYEHQLVTGTLLSSIFGGSTVTIHGSMVMGRE